MSVRLQLLKNPDKAVTRAKKICENSHATDGNIAKCKDGVDLLRSKAQYQNKYFHMLVF